MGWKLESSSNLMPLAHSRRISRVRAGCIRVRFVEVVSVIVMPSNLIGPPLFMEMLLHDKTVMPSEKQLTIPGNKIPWIGYLVDGLQQAYGARVVHYVHQHLQLHPVPVSLPSPTPKHGLGAHADDIGRQQVQMCPLLSTAGNAVLPSRWIPPEPAPEWDAVALKDMRPPPTEVDPTALVEDLIRRGLIWWDEQALGCSAPARCFKKTETKGGIIVDRRAYNYLEAPPPPLKGVFASVAKLYASVAAQMMQGCMGSNVYFAVADVASAYWASVLPHALRFSLHIQDYVSHFATNRMLFGHHWGPYCIHGYLHELAAPRPNLQRIVAYLQIIDDMLWMGAAKEIVEWAARQGTTNIARAGYTLDGRKTQLAPQLHARYLGHHVSRCGISVDVTNWWHIATQCLTILAESKVLFYSKFLRLCGLLLQVCIHPLAKMRLAVLYIRFFNLGLLPVTDLVTRQVCKILTLGITPMGPPPVPMVNCPEGLNFGLPRWLIFVDAAVITQMAGCVVVQVGTRCIYGMYQYNVPRFAASSQQAAELYAAYKALWIARTRSILNEACLITDNAAVWWQLVQPRVCTSSALRRKLLMRIFKLPFHKPMMVGWIKSEHNPADLLSREAMAPHNDYTNHWGYAEVCVNDVPSTIRCRLQSIISPWLDPNQHSQAAWSCHPPMGGSMGPRGQGPMEDQPPTDEDGIPDGAHPPSPAQLAFLQAWDQQAARQCTTCTCSK